MKNFNQEGQGLTEYLILVMLISVVSIVAVQTLGNTIQRKLQTVQREINTKVTVNGQ